MVAFIHDLPDMPWAAFIALGAFALAAILAFRDDALKPGVRAVLPIAMAALGLVGFWRFVALDLTHAEACYTIAAVYLFWTVGSGGRPAIIMSEFLMRDENSRPAGTRGPIRHYRIRIVLLCLGLLAAVLISVLFM